MTLIDRAQQAREALYARYDKLSALWIKAEEELVKFHIPRPVTCECLEYEDSHDANARICEALGVQKINGNWRICHSVYPLGSKPESTGWTPITECPVETRVLMTELLPDLRADVVKSAEEFIPEVDKAIEELEKTLARLPNEYHPRLGTVKTKIK
jgi:hypothetical protein